MSFVYVDQNENDFELKKGDVVPSSSIHSKKGGTKNDELFNKAKQINGNNTKSQNKEELISALDGAEIVVLAGQ